LCCVRVARASIASHHGRPYHRLLPSGVFKRNLSCSAVTSYPLHTRGVPWFFCLAYCIALFSLCCCQTCIVRLGECCQPILPSVLHHVVCTSWRRMLTPLPVIYVDTTANVLCVPIARTSSARSTTLSTNFAGSGPGAFDHT
jgi:hypothetical protein